MLNVVSAVTAKSQQQLHPELQPELQPQLPPQLHPQLEVGFEPTFSCCKNPVAVLSKVVIIGEAFSDSL